MQKGSLIAFIKHMGDSRDVLCFHLMTSRKVNHASVRHRGPLAPVFVFVFIFYFFGLKGDKTLCKKCIYTFKYRIVTRLCSIYN